MLYLFMLNNLESSWPKRQSKHRQLRTAIHYWDKDSVHCVLDQTFALLPLLTLCGFGGLPFSRSDILKSSPKSKNFDRRVFLFSLVCALQLVVWNFWGFVNKSTMAEMLVLNNRSSVKFLVHPTVPILWNFQFKKMLISSQFCSIIKQSKSCS